MRLDTFLEEVRTHQKELDPRSVALTLAALLPYLIGLLIGGVVKALWQVVTWLWSAGVAGYRTARGDV